MPYRIAMVGSGSAGPAAGIFLARAGHKVTSFERAEEELAVGAGFLVQPTGLAVLEELGLAREVLALTQRIDGLFCRTAGGKVLLDLKYAELQEGLFGLGTHRSSLLKILLKALKEAGAEMKWGREMVSIPPSVREIAGSGLSAWNEDPVFPEADDGDDGGF